MGEATASKASRKAWSELIYSSLRGEWGASATSSSGPAVNTTKPALLFPS